MQGFPALVDTGSAVDIRVLASRSEADRATAIGVRRLLLLATSPPWKRVLALLDNQQKLTLGHNPHGSVPALLDDALAAAVDSVIAAMPQGKVRCAEDFDAAVATVRQQSTPRVLDIMGSVAPILDQAREVSTRLDRLSAPGARPMKEDVQRQLAVLIRPGFVAATGYRRLPRLLVYLGAMRERLDKGVQDLGRDGERMEQVHVVREELDALLASLAPHRRLDSDVVEIRWQIEELRVSLFAQRLGTPQPVSPQRIYAAMDRVDDSDAR